MIKSFFVCFFRSLLTPFISAQACSLLLLLGKYEKEKGPWIPDPSLWGYFLRVPDGVVVDRNALCKSIVGSCGASSSRSTVTYFGLMQWSQTQVLKGWCPAAFICVHGPAQLNQIA